MDYGLVAGLSCRQARSSRNALLNACRAGQPSFYCCSPQTQLILLGSSAQMLQQKTPPCPPSLSSMKSPWFQGELTETLLKIFPIIAPTSANLTTDERSASQQPSKTKKKHQKKNKTKQHTNTQIVLTCANWAAPLHFRCWASLSGK